MRMLACAVAAVFVALPGAVLAEPDGISGFAAAGPWVSPDYEGSEDHRLLPLALGRIRYRAYYLQVEGALVRANLLPGDAIPLGDALAVRAGPSMRYRFARDDVENSRVDRLRDVGAALEIGGFVAVESEAILHDYDAAFARIEVLRDAAGAHDGLLVSLGASYASALSRWAYAALEVVGTYADGDYHDTYFGIDADNAARSGLARFDAGEGFKNVRADLSVGFIVTDSWHVLLIGRYARLLGDAADSPVVAGEGSASQLSGGVAISYRF